jgi:hypothetical protein
MERYQADYPPLGKGAEILNFRVFGTRVKAT